MTGAPAGRGSKSATLVTRAAAIAAAVSTLTSCVGQGGTVLPHALAPAEPPSVELADTPFYADAEHQFAPAALAIVLNASGAATTAAELEALLATPSPNTTMQARLLTVPHQFARLSYRIAPDLAAVQAELEGGRPVLVRLNSGASLLSKWRFAVVIGYNAPADTIVLRSAAARRQALPARSFMLTWSNADRWAMLVLRPGELPAAVSRDRYLEAAADFQPDARPQDAVLAFDAALKRWPDEPLAWIGRAGVRLQAGDLVAASHDLSTALRIDGSNAEARDSLAMALLDLGCIHKAQGQIDKIAETALPAAQRRSVERSRDRIADRSQNLLAQEPPVCAQF